MRFGLLSDTHGRDDLVGGVVDFFSEEDVEIVAARTGVPEEKAREALEETGDLAAAVQKLE